MKNVVCSWEKKFDQINQSLGHWNYSSVSLLSDTNINSARVALFLSRFFSSDGIIVDATSNLPFVCRKLLQQDLTFYQQVNQNYYSTKF